MKKTKFVPMKRCLYSSPVVLLLSFKFLKFLNMLLKFSTNDRFIFLVEKTYLDLPNLSFSESPRFHIYSFQGPSL